MASKRTCLGQKNSSGRPGVILAVILSRLFRSLVVVQKQGAADIAGFAAGLACFALVAVLATLSPALRALRIDPSTTLRDE